MRAGEPGIFREPSVAADDVLEEAGGGRLVALQAVHHAPLGMA